MSRLRRIANLFSRSRIEHEIDAELLSHIQLRIDDNLAAGMSPEDARRDALLRFGNRAVIKESAVGMDAALILDSIWSDIAYACRQFVKNPGFAITAILVLALGICASVAIFAFVDAVLIRPLPYANPSRLVGLYESTPLGPRFHLSYLDYLDWKQMNHVFADLEGFDNNPAALHTPDGAQSVDTAEIGAGFFRMLGIAPILGRDFRSGEDTMDAPRTVILSYSAWQKRFGGRQDILGQTVTLDDTASVVVGVLPQGFQFAPAGAAEFWMPMHHSLKPDDRGGHGMTAFARLKDGVSFETASANMSAIAARLAKQYPDADEGRGATVVPLTEIVIGSLRPTLLLLLCGAALLLLIACVNVSGLLLVRFQSRQREISVRGALGATPARLIRQFATEAIVLTTAGTSLGLASGFATIRLLRQLVPRNMLEAMPYLNGPGLNPHVLLFAIAIALASAALLSLIAVLRAPLSNLRPGLTENGRGVASTVWRHLGANLVILELCTATILLVAAGLLTKSFYKLLHTDLGLEPGHLAALRMWAPTTVSKDPQIVALGRRVISEVSRLPGVQSVALAHQIPIADVARGATTFQIVGRPHNANNDVNGRWVSAGFFNTIQARLASGRWFSETDDASHPHVAIINQALAQKYFPGEDAVGKLISFDDSQPHTQIVGVVENLREGSLDSNVQPAIYTPFDQTPDPGFYVVVRTAQPPQAILTSLEDTIHRIDRNILILSTETMEDRIGNLQSTWLHRSSAWLVGGFAAIALLLVVVGLYGVIAYSVSQRTREIGVRMALGARRSTVYRLILTEAGRLIAIGIGAGLAGAIAAAMLMSKLLYGTRPWDGITLAAVAIILAASAALASFIPARRASRVQPIEALRSE